MLSNHGQVNLAVNKMATPGRSIITSKGSSRTPLAEGCLAQLTRPPWDSSFSPLRQEWPPASTFHKSAHFTQLSLKATEEPGHESMKTLENFKEDTAQIWVQNLFVCFFFKRILNRIFVVKHLRQSLASELPPGKIKENL